MGLVGKMIKGVNKARNPMGYESKMRANKAGLNLGF